MDILSTVANVFSGGATGLIGAGINIYSEHKKKTLEMELQKQQAQDDRAMFALEAQHADKIATRQIDSQQELAAVDLMNQSIKSDKATYSTGAAKALESIGEKSLFGNIIAIVSLSALVSVDVLRGYTRPLLTVFLTIGTFYLSVQPEGNPEVKDAAAGGVFFMASTALGWWFGTRGLSKKK